MYLFELKFAYNKPMRRFLKNIITSVAAISFIILQIVLLIIVLILRANKNIAEFWATSFSRFWLQVTGRTTELVGFSVFEAFVIVAIMTAIALLVWAIFLFITKKPWEAGNRLLIIAAIVATVVTSYNLSVGPTYKRKALPISKYQGEVNKEELKGIATYFVNDWNCCADQLEFNDKGEIVLPYSRKQLIKNIRNEYKKLDNNSYFNKYTPTVKPLILSGFFSANGVVGIFFGPTGEANYNTYSTMAELPFYIAHEMAHGKGVMREDDAQLVATYICLNSEDPLLRYSAYYNTIDRIIDITHYSDDQNDYKEVNKLIGEKVRKNSKYIYEHWKGKYFLAELGDKINDWYLKTFGQKQGTTSYQDTDTEVDEVTHKIYLSNYQNIYFNNYYKENTF